MAAKKKGKRITKAPSGTSFTYAPPTPYGPLMHTWPLDPDHDCDGTIVMIEGELPAVSGGAVFICTGCDWTSPDGFRHNPTKRQIMPRPKPRKKQKPVLDSPELRAAVNAEVRKRMARLTAERAKFPPTFLKKGKKLVNNPKFTDAMRDHMHKFYVDAVEIRDEFESEGSLKCRRTRSRPSRARPRPSRPRARAPSSAGTSATFQRPQIAARSWCARETSTRCFRMPRSRPSAASAGGLPMMTPAQRAERRAAGMEHRAPRHK